MYVIFFLSRLLKYHEISLAGKVIFMEKNQNKLKINYKVWYLHNEYERKLAHAILSNPWEESRITFRNLVSIFLHPKEMCNLENFTDSFRVSKT